MQPVRRHPKRIGVALNGPTVPKAELEKLQEALGYGSRSLRGAGASLRHCLRKAPDMQANEREMRRNDAGCTVAWLLGFSRQHFEGLRDLADKGREVRGWYRRRPPEQSAQRARAGNTADRGGEHVDRSGESVSAATRLQPQHTRLPARHPGERRSGKLDAFSGAEERSPARRDEEDLHLSRRDGPFTRVQGCIHRLGMEPRFVPLNRTYRCWPPASPEHGPKNCIFSPDLSNHPVGSHH